MRNGRVPFPRNYHRKFGVVCVTVNLLEQRNVSRDVFSFREDRGVYNDHSHEERSRRRR